MTTPGTPGPTPGATPQPSGSQAIQTRRSADSMWADSTLDTISDELYCLCYQTRDRRPQMASDDQGKTMRDLMRHKLIKTIEAEIGRKVCNRGGSVLINPLKDAPYSPNFFIWRFSRQYPSFPNKTLSDWSNGNVKECDRALREGFLSVVNLKGMFSRDGRNEIPMEELKNMGFMGPRMLPSEMVAAAAEGGNPVGGQAQFLMRTSSAHGNGDVTPGEEASMSNSPYQEYATPRNGYGNERRANSLSPDRITGDELFAMLAPLISSEKELRDRLSAQETQIQNLLTQNSVHARRIRELETISKPGTETNEVGLRTALDYLSGELGRAKEENGELKDLNMQQGSKIVRLEEHLKILAAAPIRVETYPPQRVPSFDATPFTNGTKSNYVGNHTNQAAMRHFTPILQSQPLVIERAEAEAQQPSHTPLIRTRSIPGSIGQAASSYQNPDQNQQAAIRAPQGLRPVYGQQQQLYQANIMQTQPQPPPLPSHGLPGPSEPKRALKRRRQDSLDGTLIQAQLLQSQTQTQSHVHVHQVQPTQTEQVETTPEDRPTEAPGRIGIQVQTTGQSQPDVQAQPDEDLEVGSRIEVESPVQIDLESPDKIDRDVNGDACVKGKGDDGTVDGKTNAAPPEIFSPSPSPAPEAKPVAAGNGAEPVNLIVGEIPGAERPVHEQSAIARLPGNNDYVESMVVEPRV